MSFLFQAAIIWHFVAVILRHEKKEYMINISVIHFLWKKGGMRLIIR